MKIIFPCLMAESITPLVLKSIIFPTCGGYEEVTMKSVGTDFDTQKVEGHFRRKHSELKLSQNFMEFDRFT